MQAEELARQKIVKEKADREAAEKATPVVMPPISQNRCAGLGLGLVWGIGNYYYRGVAVLLLLQLFGSNLPTGIPPNTLPSPTVSVDTPMPVSLPTSTPPTNTPLPAITSTPKIAMDYVFQGNTAGVICPRMAVIFQIMCSEHLNGSFRISFWVRLERQTGRGFPSITKGVKTLVLSICLITELGRKSFSLDVYQDRTYDVHTFSGSTYDYIVGKKTPSKLINPKAGRVEITADQGL